MSERNRLFAIIGLGLLVVLVIVALVVGLLRKKPAAPAPAAPAPVEAPQGGLEVSGSTPPAEKPSTVTDLLKFTLPSFASLPPEIAGPSQTAELFAERYGSYSNQSEYQNLRDLLPIMTDRFRRESEAKLAALPTGAPAEYVGVTSVKLSSKLVATDDARDRARVNVLVQETKTTASAPPTTSYRTYVVHLVKVNDEWKVDSIETE
jgi:hypothetical protein